MTNGTRFVRELDPTNDRDRGLPCVVRHPDAGGPCPWAATMKLYGLLNFCPEHGEEARIGAEMEAHHDAEYFFERFRNPHVPDLNAVVDLELEAAVGRIHDATPSDAEYYRALCRAFPEPPEYVREQIVRWGRDEEADGSPPVDLLLDSLLTVRKLMRLAHEDGEDWLVEILEHERQQLAARAAFACGISGLLPA